MLSAREAEYGIAVHQENININPLYACIIVRMCKMHLCVVNKFYKKIMRSGTRWNTSIEKKNVVGCEAKKSV